MYTYMHMYLYIYIYIFISTYVYVYISRTNWKEHHTINPQPHTLAWVLLSMYVIQIINISTHNRKYMLSKHHHYIGRTNWDNTNSISSTSVLDGSGES
jgi:hypothetical protein